MRRPPASSASASCRWPPSSVSSAKEGRVIRIELVALAYYVAFTGLLSLLFVCVIFPGVF